MIGESMIVFVQHNGDLMIDLYRIIVHLKAEYEKVQVYDVWYFWKRNKIR